MPGDPFAEDRSQDAPAVTEGLEIAVAVDPVQLEARDLGHPQPRLGGAEVDQRLDFEAVDVGVQLRQAAAPEGGVPVGEVAVVRAVQQIRETGETPVPELSDQRHVVTSAALDETRALGEVRTA